MSTIVKKMPPEIAARLEQRNDEVDATLIAGLIEEHLTRLLRQYGTAQNMALTDLAAESAVGERQLRQILAGTRRRITKLTAAKIQHAIGEPLRPEMKAMHQAWVEAERTAGRERG